MSEAALKPPTFYEKLLTLVGKEVEIFISIDEYYDARIDVVGADFVEFVTFGEDDEDGERVEVSRESMPLDKILTVCEWSTMMDDDRVNRMTAKLRRREP